MIAAGELVEYSEGQVAQKCRLHAWLADALNKLELLCGKVLCTFWTRPSPFRSIETARSWIVGQDTPR